MVTPRTTRKADPLGTTTTNHDPADLVAGASLVDIIAAQNRAEWFDLAACRGTSPAMFHPTTPAGVERALQVCGTCAVMSECRDWALADPSLDARAAVLGGMSATARKAHRRAAAARNRRRTSATA